MSLNENGPRQPRLLNWALGLGLMATAAAHNPAVAKERGDTNKSVLTVTGEKQTNPGEKDVKDRMGSIADIRREIDELVAKGALDEVEGLERVSRLLHQFARSFSEMNNILRQYPALETEPEIARFLASFEATYVPWYSKVIAASIRSTDKVTFPNLDNLGDENFEAFVKAPGPKLLMVSGLNDQDGCEVDKLFLSNLETTERISTANIVVRDLDEQVMTPKAVQWLQRNAGFTYKTPYYVLMDGERISTAGWASYGNANKFLEISRNRGKKQY